MDERTLPPGFRDVEDIVDRVCSATDSTVKKTRGNEIILSPCPLGGCRDDRFAINSQSGLWNCPKCGQRGNAYQLVDQLSLGPVRAVNPARRKSVSSSRRLSQRTVDQEFQRHRTALGSDPAAAAELERRGISMRTADAWRLCWKHGAVGFPYFRQNGTLAFIKFKPAGGNGSPQRWPSKAEMPTPVQTPLFTNSSFDETTELVITEGEWDALALWEAGIFNVASVANGAGSWSQEWTMRLAPCSRVHLAYDQDEHGEKGIQKAVEALGRHVCLRLTFGTHKDANDALMGGWSPEQFQHALIHSRRMRPEILRSFPEMAADYIERHCSGDTLAPLKTGFGAFDQTQRGLRRGEMTVITADTGHGKTTFTLDVCLRLAESGTPAVFVSMEQGPDATTGQVLSMLSGLAVDDMERADFQATLAKSPQHLYIATEPECDRVEHVAQAIRYARVVHGVAFAVVDHLDYLIEVRNRESRYDAANRATKTIQALARDEDMHIVLICQPTSESGRSRGAKPRPLGIQDIAETRTARQLAHNGWVWDRKPGTNIGRLYVQKARHNAAASDVTMEFRFQDYRFTEIQCRPGRPK